jgi:hypothetical protein
MSVSERGRERERERERVRGVRCTGNAEQVEASEVVRLSEAASRPRRGWCRRCYLFEISADPWGVSCWVGRLEMNPLR